MIELMRVILKACNAQHALGAYFSMPKAMDRGVSPSLSSSTIGGMVNLQYDAFGESLLRTFGQTRHRACSTCASRRQVSPM